MKNHYSTITNAFEKCEIDAGGFAHEDHIGVAFEMLHRYDFMTASHKYATSIRTIAAEAGAAKKYNTTITLAFMSIIAERMQQGEQDDYETFISQNRDLLEQGVLEQWYSEERLQSDLARTTFLMPDLDPVDVPE